MPTLIVSTRSIPAAQALMDAARAASWNAFAFDENPRIIPQNKAVFYGGTDLALEVASCYNLALLEAPFDLLPKLPIEFRLRIVEYGCFSDLQRLKKATFIKPADALNKSFDAGVYSRVTDIRAPEGINPRTPILASEPVEWSAEFRCFIVERQIAAWSRYVSFGRPVWKPFTTTSEPNVPKTVRAFCNRLLSRPGIEFPPAFVMDIGMIDDRGWAVVEFNPAWCSGLLGADPHRVLAVLDRACQNASQLNAADRQWVVKRIK
jgi:ATP-grasp domain, R2K clade family 2